MRLSVNALPTQEQLQKLGGPFLYVLTQSDFESIRQDFELLMQADPKCKTSLEAILHKIKRQPRKDEL